MADGVDALLYRGKCVAGKHEVARGKCVLETHTLSDTRAHTNQVRLQGRDVVLKFQPGKSLNIELRQFSAIDCSGASGC